MILHVGVIEVGMSGIKRKLLVAAPTQDTIPPNKHRVPGDRWHQLAQGWVLYKEEWAG